MGSESQETGSGKNLPTRSMDVDFALVLSRVIASVEDDPAQLRDVVTSSHASSSGKRLGKEIGQ